MLILAHSPSIFNIFLSLPLFLAVAFVEVEGFDNVVLGLLFVAVVGEIFANAVGLKAQLFFLVGLFGFEVGRDGFCV